MERGKTNERLFFITSKQSVKTCCQYSCHWVKIVRLQITFCHLLAKTKVWSFKRFYSIVFFQADVSNHESNSVRTGFAIQVLRPYGSCPRRRLQIQVYRQRVDRRRQGWTSDAQQALYPPGLSSYWRPVDEAWNFISKSQAYQQHSRPKWTCKSKTITYFDVSSNWKK